MCFHFQNVRGFMSVVFSFSEKPTMVNKIIYKMWKAFFEMRFNFQNVRDFINVVFPFSEKFPILLSKKMTKRGRASKIANYETTEFIVWKIRKTRQRSVKMHHLPSPYSHGDSQASQITSASLADWLAGDRLGLFTAY